MSRSIKKGPFIEIRLQGRPGEVGAPPQPDGAVGV